MLYIKAIAYKRHFWYVAMRHIADDVLYEDLQYELALALISPSHLSRTHQQVDPKLLRHLFERLAFLDELEVVPEKTTGSYL
jgi:hypothetical protein